jgi:uncharacterized protein
MRLVSIAAAAALLALPACGNAQPARDLIPALERLAQSENAEAIYHLGMAYQTGSGAQRNSAKALEHFRRAAALGDVLASYKLGCFYAGQEGDVIETDSELALQHKLVAARAGYALAQQDVAALYAAEGDMPAALAWLEKAAQQGWPDALMTYASVHNGAPGITPDAVKTAAYFRLFLERSDASEQQRQWLRDFQNQLSNEQRKRVDETVRSYRPSPSPLTMKALSGQRAAVDLVANNR